MIRAIRSLWRYFMVLTNRQKIAKTPNMLATHYDGVTPEVARVMKRLGVRSPSGMRLAMKKAGVDDAEALIEQLQHFKPSRHIRRRLRAWVERLIGGSKTPPHQAEFRAMMRQMNNRENALLKARVEAANKAVKGEMS